MTDYLTMAEVLAMHVDQIERYGCSQSVRDPGLLEAALFRPQTGYYADVIEEAAAMWESLAQNRPFIAGNKRTGDVRFRGRALRSKSVQLRQAGSLVEGARRARHHAK